MVARLGASAGARRLDPRGVAGRCGPGLSAGVMAKKFIAGATPEQAMQTVMALRRRRLAFTADLLGEAVISEAEADLYQQTCLALIRGLDGPLRAAREIPLIDRDQHGPMPRVNLSLKLSSLTAQFEPIHAESSIDRVARRLRPILRAARELGAYIHVDMEQYTYRALTLRAVLPGARGARVSRLAAMSESSCKRITAMPSRAADAAGMGRAPRRADHDPAGQGGVLGLRGLDRAAAGLARAGLPPEVAKRRVASSAAPAS